jgi:hypothetical protein
MIKINLWINFRLVGLVDKYEIKIKNIHFNSILNSILRFMEIGNRDLDKIDPDWRFAYFHAKSTKPGICTDDKP